MTKTRSMFYKASAEADELYIVANNDSRVYPMLQAIEANLTKKINKGIFEAEKAVFAFFHVMDEVSKQYKKDFGYAFTVTERYTASVEMLGVTVDEYTAMMQGVQA